MTNNEKLEEAKKLADENYSEWGQWVVECMTDDEVMESMTDHMGRVMSIEKWVKLRKTVAEIYKERENTAW